MEFEKSGGEIPPLEMVFESDRRYFEENPDAEWGIRLPHPDEWSMVPPDVLKKMWVIVTQIAPGIRGRLLVAR